VDLLFDLRIGPLVGAFVLAALTTPASRSAVPRALQAPAAGVNLPLAQYSPSASLMVVLIAMLRCR
jgi:hypothetical protein